MLQQFFAKQKAQWEVCLLLTVEKWMIPCLGKQKISKTHLENVFPSYIKFQVYCHVNVLEVVSCGSLKFGKRQGSVSPYSIGVGKIWPTDWFYPACQLLLGAWGARAMSYTCPRPPFSFLLVPNAACQVAVPPTHMLQWTAATAAPLGGGSTLAAGEGLSLGSCPWLFWCNMVAAAHHSGKMGRMATQHAASHPALYDAWMLAAIVPVACRANRKPYVGDGCRG